MPMECLQCGFISKHTDIAACPRCGANRLRFSVLAGMKIQMAGQEEEEKITVKEKKRATVGMAQWITQTILGVFVAHLLTFMAGFVMLVYFKQQKVDFWKLAETHRLVYLIAGMAIPLGAVFLSTLLACSGLYLGQFVGVAIGGISVIAISVERLFLGIPPIWHEWLIVIPGGPVIGFFLGLLVGGKKPFESDLIKKDIELKPVDAWDRKAEARYTEMRIGPEMMWKRIGVGQVAGFLWPYLAWFLIDTFFGSMYRTPGSRAAILKQYSLWIMMSGFFVGGMAGGAGTKTGFIQGAIVGGLLLFTLPPAWGVEFANAAIVTMVGIPLAIIGGQIGRVVFGPPKIYRGKKFAKDQTSEVSYETTD